MLNITIYNGLVFSINNLSVVWLSVHVLYHVFVKEESQNLPCCMIKTDEFFFSSVRLYSATKTITCFAMGKEMIMTILEWLKLDNLSGPPGRSQKSCSEKALFLATKERKLKCWLLKGWKVKSAPDFHLISGFWHSSREAKQQTSSRAAAEAAEQQQSSSREAAEQ